MVEDDFIQEAYNPENTESFKPIDTVEKDLFGKKEVVETTYEEPKVEIKPKVEPKPKVEEKKPVEKEKIVEKKPIPKKKVVKKPAVKKKTPAKKKISKAKKPKKDNLKMIKKQASSLYNSVKKSVGSLDIKSAIKSPNRKKNKARIHNIITISAVIAIIVISALILNINRLIPDSGEPVAVVNGEVITSRDVEKTMGTVPELYRELLDEEEILNQTIMNTLLLQESRRLGLEATGADVDNLIEEVKKAAQMSNKDFNKFLEAQGVTLKEMKEFYKMHLSIENLLQKVAYIGINVTDEEVKAFYDETDSLQNLTFEEVEEQLELYLLQQAQQEAYEEYSEMLLATAEIEIIGKESVVSSVEVEKYSSCAVENGLTKDTVVFIYTDSCPHCLKMKPIVTKLYDEGYNFEWANAADSSTRDLMRDCFQDVLAGGVPQFICSKNGESLVGEKPESVLREFAESCR